MNPVRLNCAGRGLISILVVSLFLVSPAAARVSQTGETAGTCPYELTGFVITNSGLSVMSAALSIEPAVVNPVRTDADGAFSICFPAPGSYAITVHGNSEYGPLPPLKDFHPETGRLYTKILLPPSTDLIQNG